MSPPVAPPSHTPTSRPPTPLSPSSGVDDGALGGSILLPSTLNGIRHHLKPLGLNLLSPSRASSTKPCARCLSDKLKCEDITVKIGRLDNSSESHLFKFHVHVVGCGRCQAAGKRCSLNHTTALASAGCSSSPTISTALEKRKRGSRSASSDPPSKAPRVQRPFNLFSSTHSRGSAESTSRAAETSAATDGHALQTTVTSLFNQLAEAKSRRRVKAAAVEDRREVVQAAFAELRVAQRELEEENTAVAQIESEFARAQASLSAFDQQAAAMARRRGDGYRSALAAAFEELPGLDNSLGDISGVFKGAESE